MFQLDQAHLFARQSGQSRSWFSDIFNLAVRIVLSVMLLAGGVTASAQTNDTPVSNAGLDRVISVQNALTLDGTESISPSGQSLSYQWSVFQAPENSIAEIQNPLSPRPVLTPDLDGDYVLQLVVVSSSGDSSEPDFVTLSTGNLAPVAVAGEARATIVGTPIVFDPEGSIDPNGDRLNATWSILSFPSASADPDPTVPVSNNLVCPANTAEAVGTYHVVSATSNQQNPHLAVGTPLAEGARETGSNSATTYYGPITMDLTGDASIYVPAGEVIEVVLSSAWGTSARAEILMSADGETYTSLGTVGNGGSVYGAYSSNILRYDDFVVPVGGARFLQVSHQNSGVRADGVIYRTQCQSDGTNVAPETEEDQSSFASLIEDEGGRFVFTPAVAGEYSVQLLVEDTQGARSTDVVNIYVGPADGTGLPSDSNIAPVANAGLSQLTSADQYAMLDGSQSTDVNGDMLTYRWSILSKPADSFSLIENASSAVARIWPDTDRTYILQLEVTDTNGLKNYDTVVLSGDFVTPFAVSGGPDADADGAIASQSASVDAANSQSGGGVGFNLAYNWSVLGLSEGTSEIENAASVSASIDFPEGSNDDPQDSAVQDAVDLLTDYNLIVFGDMDSSVDSKGRTLVGGNLFGNSATFGTQLPQGQDIDALNVVGNISGGAKNINNGGNVRLGGTVSSHLNLNGGGQLINDTGLNVTSEQSELLSLSSNLAGLAANSDAEIPNPNGQHGPGRLNASPDENGVAVFDIADGNTLFSNDRVQQIEVNANGAETIIVNIGGADIDFDRGNFVGAIKNDDLRRKIIWNFHEATDLYFERAFDGTLLAPNAHLFNRSDIRGSVIVDSLKARGPIALPGFNGTGLTLEDESEGEATNFALVQLAVTDTGNPSLAPSYSSSVLTTGNLRPVARIASNQSSNQIDPGDELTVNAGLSSDGNQDTLTYEWSILSAPNAFDSSQLDKTALSQTLQIDVPGDYILQLITSDGQLASTPVTYAFTAVNQPPVANAGLDQSILKFATVALDGSASTDPENGELSYAWVFVEKPVGSQAELSDASSASPNFEADVSGIYILGLVVSDGLQTSEIDQVEITAENRVPVAVLSGMSDGFAGESVLLSGLQSTDPDGDTLSYQWTLVGPVDSQSVLSNAASSDTMFVPDVGGTYTVNLVVSDGTDQSIPDILVIEVDGANRPPVLSPIGDKVVSLGSSLSIQLTAIDPEGDVLGYSVSDIPLPAGASFNVDTGVYTFRPTSLVPNTQSLTFSVSDGEGSDQETISVSVTNDGSTDTTEYTGQVIDAASGSPIAGVLVTAGDQTAVTGPDGTFTLTQLPVGEIVVWVASDQNTQTSPDGAQYAATQVSATLFENVSNQSNPIRLSTISGTGTITPGDSIVVNGSAFGVTLEIPANAITDMTTGAPYAGPVSIASISPQQANTLPLNIVPCQLFSIQPKTLVVSQSVTLTLQNYDNLPAGAIVDVWVFADGTFNKRGVGTVTADGSKVSASLNEIPGGAMIALAPRAGQLSVGLDQPSNTYVPSLLGEGNFSTAISLPGYTSNGANRGLSFVYNSTAAAPSPIVSADLIVGNVVPASLTSKIKIGGVDYGLETSVSTSGSNGSDSLNPGDVVRQAIQIDASNLSVGVNTYQFISVSQYACSQVGQVTEGEIFVDNQTESPFGTGWTLAELTRLYPQEDGSALIREGNGTLKNFPVVTDFSTLDDPVRLPALGPFTGELRDLDGDGDNDIVWLLPEQAGIALYENLGDERFIERGVVLVGNAQDVPANGNFTPDITQIAIADFDTDGRLDIATGSQFSEEVTILYGEGNGFTFGAPVILAELDVRSIVAADFNGDGYDDLVAFATGFSEPYFFPGNASRTIETLRAAGTTKGTMLGAVVTDINNDGLLDIVARASSGIATWVGREGEPPIREFSANALLTNLLGPFMSVTDIDGDGIDEILASSDRRGVVVFQKRPTGRYFPIDPIEAPTIDLENVEFDARDLNNDGLVDLIFAKNNSVITFLNDPEGTFEAPEITPVGFNVFGPRLGDLNGDGSLDVVVDSSAEDELFVYFSNPTRAGKFIDPLTDYTELTRNDDGSYDRRFNDGTIIAYDAAGLQTSTTDSNGNATTYEYDSEARVTRVTDPVGLVTDFTYGALGKLSQITYPDGRSATWTYNDNGDLIRAEDVNGDVTLYGYDATSRITAQTDPRGLVTEVQYGPAGRYAGSTLPDGTELRLELAKTLGLPDLGGGTYTPGSATTTSVQDGRGNITETQVNDFGSPILVTDPLGRQTIYTRDADNNVIAIDAPSSVTSGQRLLTEIDYDLQGNVIAKREAVGTPLAREMTYAYEPEFNKMTNMVDYDGFETTYTYDAFGNRLTATDPLNGVTIMTYDGRGLPTSSTDKNGNVATFVYNDRGLPVTSTDPSETISEYFYDDSGNLIRQVDDFAGSLSREMSYVYDEKNRETSMTAADGGVTTYAYDGNDNVVSTTDPTGIIETRSYDDRDRLETINDPASGTTVFTYDEDSNILRMTDALSETTEFTYDAVDRLLSSIDAKGQLRAFAYDRRDNITAVTDARANMTHMGYDELDRPTTRTNPKGEQWNFAYDARDNRTLATKPDGVILTSVYDELSRLTRVSGGDIERTYAYDPQNNLLAANGNLNGIAGPDLGFTYDGENRLGTASVTNLFGNAAQNNVFTYAYDAHDRRETMADSFGGNTAYAYDPVDRLTQVTTPQGEVFTTNYDLAGRMLGRAAPNTTVTTRAYEQDTGRLASQTQAASDTAFNGFTYDYTERGNIGEIAETGTVARTKRYSYDELERLTEVAVPDALTLDETYTLDPEGNRLSSHLSGASETDVANRLTGDDAYTYVYDLNGNLLTKTAKPGVSRPDWTYAYDALDQLISVSRDGVEVERYRYDAFGRRSVIETGNDSAVFERKAIVNDGSDRTIDLVQDVAGVAIIQNRYTHGGQVDEPLSLEVFDASGMLDQAYTYHADHLSSIRFVTDSVGTIVNAYEYDSYGRPGFELEQVSQPFRYTAREWDAATELYHYRARAYDPETGRFSQEDPLLFGAGDLNVQAYVTQNPINANDPFGLSANETSGLNSNATRSASAQARIGQRLACIFGGTATIFEVLDGDASLKEIKANLKNCSSRGLKQTTKTLTSCKVTPGGGASAGKKGQQGVNFAIEVLTEAVFTTIATEASFTDGAIKTRVDVVGQDKKTLSKVAFEVKNRKGKSLGLTKNQKLLLNQLASGGCKGVGKGTGINIDKTFIIKLTGK